MKRAAYSQDEHLYDENIVNTRIMASTMNRLVEKRARSGSPPLFVGPLVFASDGSSLQIASVKAEPSSLPGVHRLKSPQPSPLVRLWSPHLPCDQTITAALDQVIQSINGKCVFIFDSRQNIDAFLLGSPEALHRLIDIDVIRQFGIIVSRIAPTPALSELPLPYIEDPTASLGKLCRFYDYLGPTAVLAKNGQIVATCMLTRSEEAILKTMDLWKNI